MHMVLKTRTTLAEFLALPETKPYLELMDGEVFEKPMPGRKHSRMTTWLIHLLLGYLEQTGEGFVDNELVHEYPDEEWVFLPDVSVTLSDRFPDAPAESDDGPVEILPDFAIEVVSPSDKPGRLQRKIAHYMRSGVRLLWVIDPETETVTVWEPGALPREYAASERLDARPVLSDFEVDLAQLFAQLHRSGRKSRP